MLDNVTPEKAIVFIKRSVALTFCWPLPSTATRFQVIRFKILRMATVLSGTLLFLPLLYAMYVHRDDALEFTKAGCFVLATLQIMVQTPYCITQYDRLDGLISQMTAHLKAAKPYERSIFQSYVDKYCKFYAICTIWFYSTSTTMVVGTFFIRFASMQCASQVSVNGLGALLLLFATARFDIVMTELRQVDNIRSLVQCLKKYYDTRRYAEEVVYVVRYIALFAIILSILSLLFFGLCLIVRQPTATKVQLLFLAGTALLEVFMCAWPADSLMEISGNVMDGAYQSPWYKRTVEMQKNILSTLIPQRPVTIGFKLIVPALSLNYYCSYISNAFSMFTALRVVVSEDKS